MATPSPKISPSVHTLSLHDALPIFCRGAGKPPAPHYRSLVHSECARFHEATHAQGQSPDNRALRLCCVLPRSEVHTSALQSLMRSSYAVFCLKKKKHIHNTNTTTQSIYQKIYPIQYTHTQHS